MEQNSNVPESDEIQLVELIRKVWKGRKIITAIGSAFLLLGIIIAIQSKNIYTASTTFIPKGQVKGSASTRISGLASLAGIDLGSMSGDNSEIPPSLYPMLVESNPFIERILKVKVPKNGSMIEFKDYINDPKKTTGIFAHLKTYVSKLRNLIKLSSSNEKNAPTILKDSSSIRKLTLEEERVYNSVKKLIILTVDENEGFIKLNVSLENPEVAATITQNVQSLLQNEIIKFKIKNAQEVLTFTESLYFEKRASFEALQDELAYFQDRHQNISSGLFQNKLSRLESKLAIERAVNEELAKQVEQARIQLRKDTPIFTVINPVVVPNQRTRPKRTLIVIGFAFLGCCFGISYILIKDPLKKIQRQILDFEKNT